MKKVSKILFTCVIMATLISCERKSEVDSKSPIYGIWEYRLDGGYMTLYFNNNNVEYKNYLEFYDATAIYKGMYTIKNNDITLELETLETKNSSKFDYTDPTLLQKNAKLINESTIEYLDYTFRRQ